MSCFEFILDQLAKGPSSRRVLQLAAQTKRGYSRPSVNACLKTLEKDGIIRKAKKETWELAKPMPRACLLYTSDAADE